MRLFALCCRAAVLVGVLAAGTGCATSGMSHANPHGLFQADGTLPEARNQNALPQVDGVWGGRIPPAARQRAISRSGFVWPLQSGRLSSFFGRRKRHFHDGIDIEVPRGTPILAAKSGRVLYASRKIRGYGNMVLIRHADGTATVYAHAQKLIVARGDQVDQGDVLGYVGATGHATGPHLHFEVRNGRLSEDPLIYLPGGPAFRDSRMSASARSYR